MASATDELEHPGSGEVETISSAKKRLGTVVAGTYRITRHIGSGASSHVFEAEHLRLGKSFAVKVLRPELDTSRLTAQRFRREAKAVARLHSEHIVSVADCGELDDGAPYLVMELLQGEDLRSLLDREGSLSVRRAVALIIEACRGLTVVHDAGLVHRDLKPENLFVTRRSTGEDWCMVLDFGVAKLDASTSTAQGAIIGTLRYMAPEQLADSGAVNPSTDVYALGAILYECVSGKPVHHGDSAHELMFKIMNKEPQQLAVVCPHLPHGLARAVMSCLAKQPKSRPESAKQLASVLASVCSPPPTEASLLTLREDAAGALIPPTPSRRRAGKRLLAGVLVAGLAGTFHWFLRPSIRGQVGPAPGAGSLPLDVPRQAPTPKAASPLSAATDLLPTPEGLSLPPPRAVAPTPTTPRSRAASTKVAPPRPGSSAARAPGVSVGTFDPANPYGE
jgi:eukaryotic-like serine/threonine-protein kinase